MAQCVPPVLRTGCSPAPHCMPLPLIAPQVRPAQPEAQAATEEDSLELMEMILGALGELLIAC